MYKRILILAVSILMVGSAFAEPVGLMAPAFTLKTVSGEVVTNKSLAGKPTLLMFWATWCHVCRHEMPNMKALYQEKKETLNVLAIGFQDTESRVVNYVRDNPDTFVFPVAYDIDNRVSAPFAIRATPTFFLLNKEGRISMTHVGGGILQNPAFWKALPAAAGHD
jgi:thiol-disulfide isomerase/thioredoxin